MGKRRIKKELDDLRIQMNEDNSIRNLIVDENSLFEWKLTVCSTKESPNNFSYDVQISFPTEYPWKQPIIKFSSSTTHNSFDHLEQLSNINNDWHPTIKIVDVLKSLLDILNQNRLKEDLQELRIEALVNKSISNICVKEDNLSEWNLSFSSTDEPSNETSYNIQILFPIDYPLKPPLLKVLPWRQWYPWMDKSGEVCLPSFYRKTEIEDQDQNRDQKWNSKFRIVDSLKLLSDILYKKTLKADLQDLRNEALVNFTIRNILVDESNLYEWKFSIFPIDLPYNVASFRIKIEFPNDYPLNPPFITMLNKIYHPNIGSTGCICAHCVGTGQTETGYGLHALMKWRGLKYNSSRLIEIIKLVVDIVNEPLQGEEKCCNENIYDEYMNNYETFIKKAMEHAFKHGDPR